MSAVYRVCAFVVALSACIGDEPKPKEPVAGSGGAAGLGGRGAAGGGAAGRDGSIYSNSTVVGTPCDADNPCSDPQFCSELGYCSAECSSDNDCGLSPEKLQNYCEAIGSGERYCFAGCSARADCAAYVGGICSTLPDGRGNGCTLGADIAESCDKDEDCIAGLSCIGGSNGWCSPLNCGSDRECGVSVDGVQNRCVKNTAGTSICFPGCLSNEECIYFENTECSASVDGAGKSCSAISIGAPCATDDECGSSYGCAGSPESPGWCTAACSAHNDCGHSPYGYAKNLCLSTTAGDLLCFPGCSTDDDCSAYADTACNDQGVCSSSSG
jgi:hypothetical protein